MGGGDLRRGLRGDGRRGVEEAVACNEIEGGSGLGWVCDRLVLKVAVGMRVGTSVGTSVWLVLLRGGDGGVRGG